MWLEVLPSKERVAVEIAGEPWLVPPRVRFYVTKQPPRPLDHKELRAYARSIPSIPFDAEFAVTITASKHGTVDIEGKRFPLLSGARYVCTELHIVQRKGEQPVTLAGLRSIPIASLCQRAAEQEVLRVRKPASGPGAIDMVVMTMAKKRKPGTRRKPGEDEAYAATFYGFAELYGVPPTQHVADKLGIPVGTARDLVTRARRRGLLPPARRGTAG